MSWLLVWVSCVYIACAGCSACLAGCIKSARALLCLVVPPPPVIMLDAWDSPVEHSHLAGRAFPLHRVPGTQHQSPAMRCCNCCASLHAAGTQVVGRLADQALEAGAGVKGVLVRQGLQDSIMAPEDLPVFTKLRPGRILQQQTLLLSCPFSQVTSPACLYICLV